MLACEYYRSIPESRKTCTAHSQFLDSLLTRCLRTRNFNEILRVGVGKVRRVLRVSDLMIRTRARELYLCASTSLKFVQMLPVPANEAPVLYARNFNVKDNTITKVGRYLLKLCLQLLDNSRVTSQANFVRRFGLMRADKMQTRSGDIVEYNNSLQSNEARLLFGISWTPTATHEVTESLPASTNDIAMELPLDVQADSKLIIHLRSNG